MTDPVTLVLASSVGQIIQQILADATRYRMAQAGVRNASRAPRPPVMRPGVGGLQQAAEGSVLDRLNQKLNQSGHINDAFELIRARRANRR